MAGLLSISAGQEFHLRLLCEGGAEVKLLSVEITTSLKRAVGE